MHTIHYGNKTYKTIAIANEGCISLYAYDDTYVKGDYLYNVFTDLYDFCAKHHRKLKLLHSEYADSLSVKARSYKFHIEKSTLCRLIITETRIGDASYGARFKLGQYNFFKVDDVPEGTLVCLKHCVFDDCFGESQDFGVSNILKRLQTETLPKIESVVGAKNVREFTLSLEHFDNPNKYMDITTKVGIPTYRMYDRRETVFRSNCTGDDWYLATAYESSQVIRVGGDGRGLHCNRPSATCGIRPIFILDPSMIVKAKEGLL